MDKKERTLLQKQFADAEKELKQYEFSKKQPKLTPEQEREKRRLRTLLRNLGTKLGSDGEVDPFPASKGQYRKQPSQSGSRGQYAEKNYRRQVKP